MTRINKTDRITRVPRNAINPERVALVTADDISVAGFQLFVKGNEKVVVYTTVVVENGLIDVVLLKVKPPLVVVLIGDIILLVVVAGVVV